jgi:hypothetical protein
MNPKIRVRALNPFGLKSHMIWRYSRVGYGLRFAMKGEW